MRERIQRELVSIEHDEGVRICHAIESGSRAWGFQSVDSDYDVRFMYVRPRWWYQSIDLERRPDTIVRPIDGDLDVSGWDVRKTLQLFRKSNPQLLEWLLCSIVYVERFGFARRLRELVPDYHDPTASFHHYLRMARKNVRDHLQGEQVRRKQYLYVLRPLLAIRWVERSGDPAPIEFEQLVDRTLEQPEVRAAIDRLVAEKKAGTERGVGPKIPPLDRFIRDELSRHASSEPTRRPAPAVRPLNELLSETIDEAWAESS